MRGAILYGPRDVRVEERADPAIIAPTDAVIRLAATAEVYGPYVNEELVGEALQLVRDKVVIATKFGWRIEDGKSAGCVPMSSTCSTSTGSTPACTATATTTTT